MTTATLVRGTAFGLRSVAGRIALTFIARLAIAHGWLAYKTHAGLDWYRAAYRIGWEEGRKPSKSKQLSQLLEDYSELRTMYERITAMTPVSGRRA